MTRYLKMFMRRKKLMKVQLVQILHRLRTTVRRSRIMPRFFLAILSLLCFMCRIAHARVAPPKQVSGIGFEWGGAMVELSLQDGSLVDWAGAEE